MEKVLKLILGVIFLGAVLVIPSGIQAQYDGLPWVNGAETLTLSVAVPFLLASRSFLLYLGLVNWFFEE